MVTITNVPTAHGASHGSGGNDPTIHGSITLGATGTVVFTERTEPANGAANTATVYAKDNGSGKTQLMVRFATGASVQIAIEP